MNKISCKFKFECDKRWGDLAETTEDGVRHCGNCNQNVYLAETQEEFEKYAEEEKCVAIETIEFAMAGMPDGQPFIEYRVVVENQKLTAADLATLRDIISNKISLSEVRKMFHQKEGGFEALSKEQATVLSKKLEIARIRNRIEEES